MRVALLRRSVRLLAAATLALAVTPPVAEAAATGPLAVATSTVAATVPRGAGPTADEVALAERYAPLVRLVDQAEQCGPGEPFEPTDVAALLGNDTVALRGPWDADDLVTIGPTGEELGKGLLGYHLDLPGNPLRPGCTYEEWAEQQVAGHSPTTYARVATERGKPGVALQYWFYYPFNDFNNKHESDWEMIQVEFDAPDAATALTVAPTRVGYSQHEGVEVATWGDPKLEIVDGTHPVVHPAAGSHANYFDAALFLGRSGQQGFGCDDTRTPAHDVRPVVDTVPAEPAAAKARYPWLAYEGRWGQRETSFYNGPTGPNTKDQWTAPITWMDKEGADQAFAVPASGLFGTQATSAFCGIVKTGSDVLRVALANPLWTVAALTGLLLVLAWLVRRTTWRPTAPLRIGSRRSTGQVLAAVARMYLSRPLLFLLIGVPIALASILPGAVSAWLTDTADAVQGQGTRHGVLADVVGVLLVALAPLSLSLGQAATVVTAQAIDEGRRPGLVHAYAGGLRRLGPLVLLQVAIIVVLTVCLLTVVLLPAGLVVLVLGLLVLPVVVVERRSGWAAFRRSAALVRRHWLKAVLLVGLTHALTLVIGPVLGTSLILVTSLPFEVSNAVAGLVYALLIPVVALNSVYVFGDLKARHELEPRPEHEAQLPAEVTLGPPA